MDGTQPTQTLDELEFPSPVVLRYSKIRRPKDEDYVSVLVEE